MALIQCPECGREVSSYAGSCPNCGYPLSDYTKELEIKRLTEKILPCEFTVPAPRVKICIKCTRPFQYVNPSLNDFKKPMCSCGMAGVEVDYPEHGYSGGIGKFLYIVNHDIIPRNIGDQMSKEYQDCIGEIEEHNEWRKAEGRPPVTPIPPDPKDFGISVEYKPRKHMPLSSKPEPKLPHCPFCSSTDLTRISSVGKAVKILALGLYGMDDAGKTYRCNNCGGKF